MNGRGHRLLRCSALLDHCPPVFWRPSRKKDARLGVKGGSQENSESVVKVDLQFFGKRVNQSWNILKWKDSNNSAAGLAMNSKELVIAVLRCELGNSKQAASALWTCRFYHKMNYVV